MRMVSLFRTDHGIFRIFSQGYGVLQSYATMREHHKNIYISPYMVVIREDVAVSSGILTLLQETGEITPCSSQNSLFDGDSYSTTIDQWPVLDLEGVWATLTTNSN